MQVSSLREIFAQNHPILNEHEAAKRSRRNGLIGALVIASVLAATGVAFVNTNGMETYAVHLRASGGLRAGDDVRIAGISVGKVSTVSIDRSLVKATFTVNHSVPVGSESRTDVRMLTPLGGHYLALYPEGSTPLGGTPIPPERTSIPFEINELFQEFTPVVKKVDAKVIHDSLMEVANAVDKYPNGLRDFLQSSQTLIRALEPTTEDFHATLNYANEYLRAFKTGKEQLARIVITLSKLGAKYSKSTTDLIEVFVLLRDLIRLFNRFFEAYARDYEPMLNGLDDIVDTLTKYPEKLGKAAEQWGQLVGIVLPMLSGNGITINENDRVIPGQDVCLPHFFRFC
ncbi:putative Mce family protein [Mycobacteroides stephanolepidis]|uniref:Putative Mce family protein n=1 Tax=[Mycobacterium] stephanolepidis TaxID=1520670 RepID=A0A1Z4F2R0_9MYCO|nr:MCE family protein [[Mycobacterium] stephanolepidis]BAX99496.1 putative Mce family protein [[Mycobacterium] stephanolepidis]